jgi:glycosyltransferase involved in cell wall biosynthesis
MIASQVEEFHLCYISGKLEEENILLHRLNLPNLTTFSIPLAFATAVKATRLCRKHRIDLIYVLDGPYYEWAAYLTSILMRVPWILRLRTNPVRLRLNVYKNPIKRYASNLLTKYIVRRANRLICISHELKDLVLGLGADSSKVAIVYHGVDVNKFRPLRVKKPYPKVALFVGGIRPEKGIYDLLKAADMLKDVHFLLVGNIDMKMPRMPENVHYLGIKPHSDMPKYYNMSDVLVNPSYTEGTPDAILEAFACEKPVIASRVGEISRIVTPDYGWLIEPGNVQQLCEALRKAFSDKEKLRIMGVNARKYVSDRFTWKRYSEEMIQNFNAALRNY